MDPQAHLQRTEEQVSTVVPAWRLLVGALAAGAIVGCTKAVAPAAPLAQPVQLREAAAPPVKWNAFAETLLRRADAEHRLVLLALEAGDCVHCRRMDRLTYRSPRVERLVAARFLAAKADLDARPDLEARYGGASPIVIVLRPDGVELAKHVGFMSAEELEALLLQASSATGSL